MPFYTFRSRVTEEEQTLEMTMAEREQFIVDNPDLEQIIAKSTFLYNTGVLKHDNGWTDMLGRIKSANRGSTIDTGNLGET